MTALQDWEKRRWPQQRHDLYNTAKAFGVDDSGCYHLADQLLRHWAPEELAAVLRKIPGMRPGVELRTMTPGVVESAKMIKAMYQSSRDPQTSAYRIKAPQELIARSAKEGLALCVNRTGDFALKSDNYYAISHVWSEGIQGDAYNRGIAKYIVDRLFQRLSVFSVDWIWLDVISIPSGHQNLSVAEEIQKTGIINSLAAIYSNATAVVILDALVMRLQTEDPVDVAVALLCGKWMTRVWTYQEIVLANRALILTGSGSMEFSTMVAQLKTRNAGMHWNSPVSDLTPVQMKAWQKHRLIYMVFDVLLKSDINVSIADIAFSCSRRTASNNVDYARAFFPVLGLKWQAGMTREQGMRAIYESKPFGYSNASRIMVMYGRPRTYYSPGWAPDSLCGLTDGVIFDKSPRFRRWLRGLEGSWQTYKIAEITETIIASNCYGLQLLEMPKFTPKICLVFHSPAETKETVDAAKEVVKSGKAYFLAYESFERTGLTGLLVEKCADMQSNEAYVIMVMAVGDFQKETATSLETWLLRSENPMNLTYDGGRNRAEAFLILEQMESASGDASRWDSTHVSQLKVGTDDSTHAGKRSALHEAAMKGDIEAIRFHVKEGADINAKDSQGATPLYLAADIRKKHAVEELLNQGANIHECSALGTALIQSILRNDIETVHILLNRGANPNGFDNDIQWPLMLASDGFEITSLLLEHGADPNRTSSSGLRALQLAARAGNLEVAECLIQAGAYVNEQVTDKDLSNPLHDAILYHMEIMVELLLSHGADPNIRYADGKTPLMIAAEIGDVPIIGRLLTAGAMTDTTTASKKWSAVHFAASQGRRLVVKLLLERGANGASLDADGRTPAELAKVGGHVETFNLLKARPQSESIASLTTYVQSALKGFGLR